jgi:hypothetical protein
MPDERPKDFPLSPETCRRIWEQFLTTRRIVEEIAHEVPEAKPHQIRHVLRTDLQRPSEEEEAELRARFVMTVATPTRLYVRPGLLVSEIETLEDLQEHLALTRFEIARIDRDLADAREGAGSPARARSPRWWAVTRSHRTYLKAVMEALSVQRSVLAKEARRIAAAAHDNSHDRLLLKLVRELDPDLMRRAIDLGRIRHPDVFPPAKDKAGRD